MIKVTVVVPTHNPDSSRLQRTLAGLCAQTLLASEWELLVIDNASSPAVDLRLVFSSALPGTRIIRESQLGLTAARRRGFSVARGEFIVLVDDDNVLAPDYLAQVVRMFAEHPRVGALGGKSLPEFESKPAPWLREFFPLLALRDLGDQPAIATSLKPHGATQNEYPAAAAPIGAGLALRREAAQAWLADASSQELSDRRGDQLTSGGDNDIVLTLLARGWHVGYFPQLSLTHLIPASRLAPGYLARLNRGIQHSWMRVLTKHHANPWPPIAAWTVPLRQLKAWFTHRAWSGAAAHIRWQGTCGHFEGRTLD